MKCVLLIDGLQSCIEKSNAINLCRLEYYIGIFLSLGDKLFC